MLPKHTFITNKVRLFQFLNDTDIVNTKFKYMHVMCDIDMPGSVGFWNRLSLLRERHFRWPKN